MNDEPAETSVLLVDDTPDNIRILVEVMRHRGYAVRVAPSGAMALQAVAKQPPDIILLDINMPQMDGYQVCERLKASAEYRDIPIVFISALNQTFDKTRAFALGAVDYVTKPFQFEEVRARVDAHLRIRRLQKDVERSRDELRRSYAELERVQALRETLVDMILHDMRTPLSLIESSLQVLGEELAERAIDDLDGDVRLAQRGAERLLRLTDDLLDVSRLACGRMPVRREPVALRDVLLEVEQLLRGTDRRRQVSVVVDPQLEVSCDRALVLRVLENLVSNALKHTPPTARIRLQAVATEDGARVSVADDGPGIPPSKREQVFDRFVQASAHARGVPHASGLGLAFCKLAIEAHGGAINVDEPTGGGTEFWFTLPGARRARATPTEPACGAAIERAPHA